MRKYRKGEDNRTGDIANSKQETSNSREKERTGETRE